jgi:uncharacterized protein YbbC (DUF1343 family)
MTKFILYLAIIGVLFRCDETKVGETSLNPIFPGAHQIEEYLPLLHNKKVGLVLNHTSTIGHVHLLDTLLALDIEITKIFTPEHGYTGQADAGEAVQNDKKNNISIISLYGDKKKPVKTDLVDVDILVFDIQDVGARFYTYISTLHYILESAAENGKPVIVLDRPNPNGYFVDGPVLKNDFQSFIGMHPVPVVYGMTIGEYALMIKGENWINTKGELNLSIIKCKNYDHTNLYDLPIKPSPNLPNLQAILLYPSLCFFEGTTLSIGRGTDKQFQLIGHPALEEYFEYSFTPSRKEGAQHPKLQGKSCYGIDLSELSTDTIAKRKMIDLNYLLDMYQKMTLLKEPFFLDNGFFDKLSGGTDLRNQIMEGQSLDEIRKSWQMDIEIFLKMRSKYLLYPDF